MATLLLVVIFIFFLGRGVPDSLFGSAWPAIYQEFHLPISYGNYINIIFAASTIVAILLCNRIVRRIGTGRAIAFNLSVMALSLLGLSFSGNFLWLILFSIPLGFGIGVVDTSISNYMALHYKATHISFMQSFYGLGVTLTPYLMSLALSDDTNWHAGYRLVFYVLLGISALAFLTLPLWKKVNSSECERLSHHEDIHDAKSVSTMTLLKNPAIVLTWLLFLGSNAVELTCGNWGSSFLVNSKGFTVDAATQVMTFYYLGMTAGRFLSGVLAFRVSSWNILKIGFGFILLAFVLLFLPLPPTASAVALFLIGLGNGPLIPNMLYLTPKCFGKELSNTIISSQLAVSYIGVMLMPAIYGWLTGPWGTGIFPTYVLLMFFIILIPFFFLVRYLKKNGNYHH